MGRIIQNYLSIVGLIALMVVGMLGVLRQNPSTAGWVAYIELSAGGRPDLYTMMPDGTQNQLVAIEVDIDSIPMFSPNGVILLYRYSPYGEDDQYCLFNMRTSRTTCFESSQHVFWWSIWLPDSQGLMFVDNKALYSIRFQDMETKFLTDLPRFNDLFAWTPNHTKIIYTTYNPYTAKGRLFWVDITEGTPHVFLKSGERDITNGGWSLDGQWLAINQGSYSYQNAPLLVDKDGNIVHEFSETLTWHTWTIDNQLVLADEAKLYLVNPKTFKLHPILNFELIQRTIILSPDGKWLIMALRDEHEGGGIAIYRLNLDSLYLELLTPTSGYYFPVASSKLNLDWHMEWFIALSGIIFLIGMSIQKMSAIFGNFHRHN